MLRIDPTPQLTARALRGARAPDFTLLLIYRQNSTGDVKALVAAAPKARLWALDGVDPALAEQTIGSGPGGRSELLNRLAAGVDTPYVVIADDDVALLRCTLGQLVATAARHGFDLCQPAHAVHGNYFHRVVRRQPFKFARLTNFIEVGPLLVIGPRLRDVLLPLPNLGPMGWGTELVWIDAQAAHAGRFAIIDAIELVHLRPGGSYGQTEGKILAGMLAERGFSDIQQAQRWFGTIWPWTGIRRL